jgi:hypothetical protein
MSTTAILKLAIAIAGSLTCAASAGLITSVDEQTLQSPSLVTLILVGTVTYLLGALALSSVMAALRWISR